MFDIIGDAAVQRLPRGAGAADGMELDAAVKRAEQVREVRSVEPSAEADRSKPQGEGQEPLQTRNRLENGKIIVEKYDEDGKLVKKTPPGYLPFGEMA
jgi:hypothetical protein